VTSLTSIAKSMADRVEWSLMRECVPRKSMTRRPSEQRQVGWPK
jgi:hypothetical protein